MRGTHENTGALLVGLALLCAPGLSRADSDACGLLRGPETASTEDCIACHRGPGPAPRLHTTHPVDVDYERARLGRGSSLRPQSEVVRRGVFLPEGQVRCLTCHDRRSPWRYKLAIPHGSRVRPHVRPGDPSTYAPLRSAGRTAPRPDPDLPAEERHASPTPLCLACHAYD